MEAYDSWCAVTFDELAKCWYTVGEILEKRMTVGELDRLIGEIRQRKAEGQTIEVKSARCGCPESLFDTLSSFSNQPSGGTIVFGLDEHNEFELCGVYDAQDLQHKVTQQCKSRTQLMHTSNS